MGGPTVGSGGSGGRTVRFWRDSGIRNAKNGLDMRCEEN